MVFYKHTIEWTENRKGIETKERTKKTVPMKTTLLFAMLTLTFMGIFYACTKGDASDSGTTVFTVRLTDNPFAAEEVNVDIQEVRINFQGGSDEWVVLPTRTGIYNLLDLQNGVDTIIASGAISGRTIGDIRVVLGTNNSIRIRNKVYPMAIPSGAESGLKIKAGKQLAMGGGSVTVDFDAALSVHEAGNGTYMLKPVLKLK